MQHPDVQQYFRVVKQAFAILMPSKPETLSFAEANEVLLLFGCLSGQKGSTGKCWLEDVGCLKELAIKGFLQLCVNFRYSLSMIEKFGLSLRQACPVSSTNACGFESSAPVRIGTDGRSDSTNPADVLNAGRLVAPGLKPVPKTKVKPPDKVDVKIVRNPNLFLTLKAHK